MIDLKKVAKSKRWDAQFRNRKKERKNERKKDFFNCIKQLKKRPNLKLLYNYFIVMKIFTAY
jgi:hypothetical protein